MDPKEIDYERLAMTLLAQQNGGGGGRSHAARRKAVSSTPSSTFGHGVTGPQPNGVAGLFSYPGLEPNIVNAMVMPRMGLIDAIPSRTSVYDNPLYGIMTGVTASVGSEPSGVCDDPPVAGLMKLCTHAFVWGRFSRETPVMDITRAGRFINRSDFNDLTLVGDPLQNGFLDPQQPGNASPDLAVRSELAKKLFEFSVAWGRDFAPILYTGNPTNNTANGGYREPYGLDILINDGYRDAETGVACPAADSIVRDFGSVDIASDSLDFVLQVTNVIRNLRYNASRMGLAPASWALVMSWALFYQVTEVWPCAYSTYRCTVLGENNRGVIDIMAQNQMRDDMRGDIDLQTGQYLLVDGQRIPVIIDDGVAETVLPGASFTSSIYFVPMRYAGNRPATFLEYINYDGPLGAMEMAQAVAPQGSYYTTNTGRFLWHAKPPTIVCTQLYALTEWRVILETPQIAAVLQNVKYTPVAHQRSPFPTSSYYVNGGGTDRGSRGPSYLSPTA